VVEAAFPTGRGSRSAANRKLWLPPPTYMALIYAQITC